MAATFQPSSFILPLGSNPRLQVYTAPVFKHQSSVHSRPGSLSLNDCLDLEMKREVLESQ